MKWLFRKTLVNRVLIEMYRLFIYEDPRSKSYFGTINWLLDPFVNQSAWWSSDAVLIRLREGLEYDFDYCLADKYRVVSFINLSNVIKHGHKCAGTFLIHKKNTFTMLQ